MTRRRRLRMDISKSPETDLSGFQEQGGYIDQETIDQLEEYDRKKKEEKNLDPRTISRRKKKADEANRERLKNLPPDEDISAQGAAKANPTKEDLKPLTPEEIEANRKGIEEAKKKMRGGPLDKDGFLDSSQIKNILKYGLPVKSTYSGLAQIGMSGMKFPRLINQLN